MLFEDIYKAIVNEQLVRYGCYLFTVRGPDEENGPWANVPVLMAAFEEWAGEHIPDVVEETAGAAADIELILHDQPPKYVYEQMEAFLRALPAAMRADAVQRLLTALEHEPDAGPATQRAITALRREVGGS